MRPIELGPIRDRLADLRRQGVSPAQQQQWLTEDSGLPPEAFPALEAGAVTYRPADVIKKEGAADFAQTKLQSPRFVESVGRGAMDVVQGAGQLVRGDAYDDQVSHEMELYDKGRGEDNLDWGRLTGQAAGLAAGGVAVAGTKAATATSAWLAGHYAPLWAQAALVGAGEGGLLSTKEGGVSRAENMAMGGVGGGLGYGLVKGAAAIGEAALDTRLGQAILDTWRKWGATGRSNTARAEMIAQEAVTNSGGSWREASEQARNALIRDVKELLNSDLSPEDAPEVLARKLRIEGEGMTATQGRVRRDPRQWSDEDNLMKIDGGEDILNVRMANQQRMNARMGEFADESGAPASPVEAGRELTEAVAAQGQVLRNAETAAYDSAANAAGRGTEVPRQTMADEAVGIMEAHGDVLEQKYGRTLKDWLAYVDGSKRLTVGEGEKLIKRVNSVRKNVSQGELGRADRAALDAVSRNIKDAVANVGEEGSEAARLGAEARALYSANRRLGKAEKLAGRSLLDQFNNDKINPDDAVRKVLGAAVDDLAAFVKYVEGGPTEVRAAGMKAVGKVRRQLVDSLWDKASSGAREAGSFSGKRLQDEIKKIGPEKMRILFPSMADDLDTFAQAAVDETYAPALNNINRSNSGTFLADLLARSTHGLSAVMETGLKGTATRKAASNTLAKPLARPGGKLRPPTNRLGPAATTAGALGAVEARRER